MKNLHPATEEIKLAIENHGHQVGNVANVRSGITKTPLSMFNIDLEPKSNNKSVYEIRHINYTIVSIVPPKKYDLIQCHQEFGHTKIYFTIIESSGRC